jgi:uncharacterized protein RhaS with RHS repeats
MSPSAGRFLTRDPIGYEGSEWGLYEYVDSSPLVYVDPTGLDPDAPWLKALGQAFGQFLGGAVTAPCGSFDWSVNANGTWSYWPTSGNINENQAGVSRFGP